MQPAIDRNTLESLIALGREKGGLTNQDLQAALPTEAMSVEDIVLVVLQLEEAGVSIDLDESLLMRRPGAAPIKPVPGAEILPFPKRPVAPAKSGLKTDLPIAPSPARDALFPMRVPMRRAHWAVAGSVLVIVLLAVLFLSLGRWGA